MARSGKYLKSALAQRPDAHDFAWLADALDKQHKAEEAAQIRQHGLLFSLKHVN